MPAAKEERVCWGRRARGKTAPALSSLLQPGRLTPQGTQMSSRHAISKVLRGGVRRALCRHGQVESGCATPCAAVRLLPRSRGAGCYPLATRKPSVSLLSGRRATLSKESVVGEGAVSRS